MRRLPFWAQALALCALFAIAGVAVLDDYGITWDEAIQREIAYANAEYIATGNTGRLHYKDYRYYGVAFEMPLLLTERALGLQDIRHINLTRHLLTHLLFIAGGFACGMLAYRMFGNRWIALLAMLIFLLHPRLYAHSFFNSKDIPFAALLAVALYLAHRAFRKDTGGAFLLCGIAAGLAINLRPFALLLPPMILAMRALDLWQADSAERKRVLASAGIFAAAALATAWITHPHYWENPLRLIDGLRVFSQHPTSAPNLFMGNVYMSNAVPWNYIPVWFAITAPPVALALGAIGVAAVCRQTITRPIAALRDRETRFRILLLACVALPVVVVIALQSNIYNGWRHMYFLWTPFCLFAAVGLHRITNISMGGGIWKFGALLPRRVSDRLIPALTYGATAIGLITTLTAMAALHPYEHIYFNALVDTKTPGALAARYDTDYWNMAQRQLLEYLLARHPDDILRVWPQSESAQILPQSDRERIVVPRNQNVDFYINYTSHYHRRDTPAPPTPRVIEAYGNDIAFILAPKSHAYLAHYRAEYNDVKANGTPLARSAFDIYAHNGALYYIKENCASLRANADYGVFLHITPADPADLPAHSRARGFENRDFWIAGRLDVYTHTAFLDGKCVTRRPLPDYPIARIRTGQKAMAGSVNGWREDIDLTAPAPAPVVHNSAHDADNADADAAPIAQSRFDIYLNGNSLTYLKETCVPGDANARVFLHIFPANPADLPADRREYGFINWGFNFAERDASALGKCMDERELPDYPIARVRTGQNAAASGGDEWRVDINLAARAAAQAAHDGIRAGDYGQPVAWSDFDLYLSDNTLTYLKSPCAPADADARFFLHIIPENPADLPADRRESGFANLNFRFADHGAYIGDTCVAERKLPDYPIARISTGQSATQNAAASGGAEWRADINLTARAAAQAAYDRILAGDYGAPVAWSDFDMYLRGNTLTYLREPCAPGDADARFFLHIIPADSANLPADRRERGFVNLNFRFADHGAYAGDICVAERELPDYPIARIITGQFGHAGSLWRAEFLATR